MTRSTRHTALAGASYAGIANVVSRLRHLIFHAVRISRLGDGPVGRLSCLFWYLVLPIKRRLPPLDRLIVVLRLRVGTERRYLAFSDRSELIAFEEIFCDGEYDVPLRVEPSIIVDAGANVGASVLWFRSRYPAARIIAVEPDPRTVQKLIVTLRGVPGVEIVEGAVAESTEPVQMVQSSRSWASKLVVGEQSSPTIVVQGVSLPDLLSSCGLQRVDLLKLDIEGSEWEVLPDAARLAGDIIVEVHGEDRVRRLHAMVLQRPNSVITWANDRVAHLVFP